MFAVQSKANVVFIHVGVPLPEQMKIFTGLLEKYGFDKMNYKIIFREGDVGHMIWDVCKDEKVDLLISGALRKEPVQKQNFGSIARGLAGSPEGNVLLLPEPQVPARPLAKIIIAVSDDNPDTVIETGIFFGNQTSLAQLYFVKESIFKVPPWTMLRYENDPEFRDAADLIIKEERDGITRRLADFTTSGLNVSSELVFGHPGLGIVNFAREIGANLIIDSHPDAKTANPEYRYPHDVEVILLNMPCNLLLFK